jgi:hypothetical protein
MKIWYAISSAAGTYAITVTMSDSKGNCAAVAFGISGADTSSPFDENYRTAAGYASGSGSTFATVYVTTSNANDFIIGVLGVDYSYSGTADTAFVPTSPFTVIKYQKAVSSRMIMDEYHIYNTVQTNLNVGCAWNFNYAGPYGIIADAIKKAPYT